MTATDRTAWSNWAGNQRFTAEAIVTPASEDEVIDLVQRAVRAGRRVGCAGAAHSFSPIVETTGVLIDMRRVSGVLGTDSGAERVGVLGGTTLQRLGTELWDAGLSMRNLGDVDVQTLGGAISTATHGSGIGFGSLSSTVCGLRIVTGTGVVLDLDESQPELLHAAQVSVGLLGVITRVSLEATTAYLLQESNRIEPVAEVLERWEESITSYRHFSFFWAPGEESGALYGLPYIPPDHCYVKMLDEVPVRSEADRDTPVAGPVGGRLGPAHLIYPDTADDVASWIELEYMIDADGGKEAFLALRALMREHFPGSISPIQVRWTKGEPAFLSPHRGNASCSLSVSGLKNEDWGHFLRVVHETLRPFKPRPHWGKMNFLDHEHFTEVYPEGERFLAVRQALDPNGLFLNDYSRAVLGL